MPDLIAYAASFVVGELSEITITDPDEDGDLEKYTDIEVTYNPRYGQPIRWPVKEILPIFTIEIDPETGKETMVVNTVVIKVIPIVPPPGCLGLFLPSFPRRASIPPRLPQDPVSTGTVSGSMNPPPGGTPPGADGGPLKVSKPFKTLDNPAIFYGTRI